MFGLRITLLSLQEGLGYRLNGTLGCQALCFDLHAWLQQGSKELNRLAGFEQESFDLLERKVTLAVQCGSQTVNNIEVYHGHFSSTLLKTNLQRSGALPARAR